MVFASYIQLCLILLGGAIGTLLRYSSIVIVSRTHGGPFPLGTMLVNIVGSFLIGLLMARFTQNDSESARLFLVTGILGGFTTFSAFSWDALSLAQRGQMGLAATYVLGSILLSFAAVAGGYAIGR